MEIFTDNEKYTERLSLKIAESLKEEAKIPVFMCIGNDRVLGDSLAPIVAELLIKKYKVCAFVYGTLDNNIDAKNVESAYQYIRKNHAGQKVFVVDATLGKMEEVGKVKFYKGGCIPAGVFSSKENIMGDFSILGVINTIGIEAKVFLSCVKIKTILKMAEFIAESIDKGVRYADRLKCVEDMFG